jgi:lipopolysaccharide transport system permease protein
LAHGYATYYEEDYGSGNADKKERPPSFKGKALLKFFVTPFLLLWKHRLLLFQTSRNEIRGRYAGSVLGLSWLVVYPILFLGVYALVYLYVFKVRFGLFNSNEYVVLIFCGLIPFLGFAEGLSLGVGSVTSNASLIKNTLFPIDLIPVKAVLVTQSTQVVGTGLLIVPLILLGKITAWALLFPVIWLAQVLLTIGLVWILSSLNVILRDLQNMIAVLILMLMMISPIAYTADMVPAALRPYLAINPLYYVVIAYQDCLMLGRFPREGIFWVLILIACVSFWTGYWFFSRMKRVFADNV